MKRIFLDTDVLLDSILDRHPFADFSDRLLASRTYQKFTSALIISNIYYITQRVSDKHEARKATAFLIEHCQVLDVNAEITRRAHNSLFETFDDFEDAIQHYCAMAHSMDTIITRNEKDFKKSEVPVYSPQKFMRLFGQ